MEFVLISSPELQSGSQPLGPLLSDVPLKNPNLPGLKFYAFDGLFLASNQMDADDISAIGFDGSAIDNHRAHNSSLSRRPTHSQLVDYLDGTMDKENKSSLRGMFCAVRLNPHTRAFNIATDPMSAYPLAICGFGETLIVSNNIALLETAVQAFGLSLSKSSKSLVMGMVLGVSPGNRTGFREVALLAPGKLVTGIGPNWRIIDKAPTAIPDFTNRKDFVSKVADRLSHNVSACKSLLNSTAIPHHSAQDIFAPVLKSGFHPTADRADSIERLWRTKNAMGSALMTQECYWRPMQTPTMSALFDFSLCPSNVTTQAETLFWKTPLRSLIEFSNSDPMFFAALTAKLKQPSSDAPALALAIARDHSDTNGIMRRTFLRQCMELMIKETIKSNNTQTGGGRAAIARMHMRQETMILSADNHRSPVLVPLLDPWFSSDALNNSNLNLDPAKLLQHMVKALGPKATPPPKQPIATPGNVVRLEALAIGEDLPSSAECWTYLNRKKTLKWLKKTTSADRMASVYSGLLQVFNWAAQ